MVLHVWHEYLADMRNSPPECHYECLCCAVVVLAVVVVLIVVVVVVVPQAVLAVVWLLRRSPVVRKSIVPMLELHRLGHHGIFCNRWLSFTHHPCVTW